MSTQFEELSSPPTIPQIIPLLTTLVSKTLSTLPLSSTILFIGHVDISAIKAANPSHSFESHSASALSDLPSSSFDAVISTSQAQFIVADEDAADFFDALGRLIRPNGILFALEWHVAAGQDRMQMLTAWRDLVQGAGEGETLLKDELFERVWADLRPRDEELIVEFFQRAGFQKVVKQLHVLVYGAWLCVKGPDDPFDY